MVAASLPAQQRTISDFFSTFTDAWVRGNPNQATATRYFSGPEQRELERHLTPLSPAWQRDRVAQARRGLVELRTFDRSKMTDTERVSAEFMDWQLEMIVQGEKYQDYFFPFEQFGGANVNIVALLTVGHPLLTEPDTETYLIRLGEVDTRMDEATAEARRIASDDLIPPRFILNTTLAQMRQFIAAPPRENPFVTVYVERLKSIIALSDATRAELGARAEAITSAEIYPAWRRAIAVLEPLVARTTDRAGLSRLKAGADAYAYYLKRFTSTDLTAEQIHQIGLGQVDRIEKEMDAIFRRLGRTEGSVKDRIAKLKIDMGYPLTQEGRTAIMSDTERYIRDAEQRAVSQFDRTPKARVMVQPFPPFREANAAASYTSPAPDGSRPGVFQIPLRPERMTRFGLRTLVYHETVPGHHFQIALEMENSAVPRFRQIRALGGISALSEGWGLYAERLAAESGWYEGDLEGLLGQLDAELFRARRLVVDTGIHAKGWTRQQAIDYGIEASEIERYVVNPGQACAYMLGELKILELRDRTRNALGSRFSVKAFHNLVLGLGTVPLNLLEREVDAYIKAQR
jgi:uncharacterized protein (DUF885 family)